MSQIEVTVSVGGEDDPLIYVSRVQTVIVGSDESQDLMMSVATGTIDLMDAVAHEVRDQLSILTDVVGDD